jgi:hypothetical protein
LRLFVTTSQVLIGEITKERDGMRDINIWQLFSTGKRGIFRVSEIRSISFLLIPFFKWVYNLYWVQFDYPVSVFKTKIKPN